MLLEKEGIERIQIPRSMIKVLPVESSKDSGAIIAFKKLSAPSGDNIYFGRHLDPNEKTTKSFMTKSHDPLSDMYQRIMKGYGIETYICDGYVKRARKTDGLKHAHLLGVADPTCCIPYGHVFIPGCKSSSMLNEVY